MTLQRTTVIGKLGAVEGAPQYASSGLSPPPSSFGGFSATPLELRFFLCFRFVHAASRALRKSLTQEAAQHRMLGFSTQTIAS